MADTYRKGERVFLQFEVENLQNNNSFTLVKADYELSAGKKVLRPREKNDSTISFSGNKITILYEPTEPGPNIMDIWYDINVGGLLGTNVSTSTVSERRTVRYIFNVVS